MNELHLFLLRANSTSCNVQAIAPLPNTQSHLLRIVSTLEKDFMKSQPPANLSDLEQYAEGTSSQLLYLQVQRFVFVPWTLPYQPNLQAV